MKPLKKINEGFNSETKDNETIAINNTDTQSSSISTINNEQLIVTRQSGNAEQVSAPLQNAVERRRNNHEMVQNVLLIWLDNNIDDNNGDCRNTIKQLRRVVNDIHTFTDGEECVEFISSIIDKKACMIISGSLGQHIVSRVHAMSQVDSIFIFCDNKDYHEQWVEEWRKIQGVYTEISSICEALKQVAQECEQNAIPIGFMPTDGDLSKKSLNQLDPMFMYSQILKEILLTIEFHEEHIQEYIDYCLVAFTENDGELQKVHRFENEYHTRTPIWWYTYECFLYPILNRVLRLMDMSIIIKMGFFINDLHRYIEQLHFEQFSDDISNQTFTVYRGQGMLEPDFQQLIKTKGGLMSFNNFLSTSKDRNVSLRFARRALRNIDMVGILFVMTINPSESKTPFASIIDVGYYGDKEDEVLFSMHTIFRIGEIEAIEGNEALLQVNLTLTSDNDEHLRALTDRVREESFPNAYGLYRLSALLNSMGQSLKSQEVFQILLEQTIEEAGKVSIYNMLGITKLRQGEYNEALSYYEKALEIKQQSLPPDHPDFGSSYNNIGEVYTNIGDYPKALSYYKKAFEVGAQSSSRDYPGLGETINNIGLVYFSMNDTPTALTYLENALEIRQQSLPPNHPDLGESNHNIGEVYKSMGDYSKALLHFEKALEIEKQSLPPNHPSFGDTYNNIGTAYLGMDDYSKALSYLERALEIKQQLLPPNHSSLGNTYNNIGLVYKMLDDYPKALSYYEKALEIKQQSLPPNHPTLGDVYNNIGNLCLSMEDYTKALPYYEKVLEIRQQSLPPNHPTLGDIYLGIGVGYFIMGDYTKASSHFEKTIEIKEQSLPPNHPSLADIYNHIGNFYHTMNNYPKALSHLEKALEIKQHLLPPNHPDLGNTYDTIGELYCKLGEYSKALAFCEKAIAIQEQSFGTNHPDLCAFYNNIGQVHEKMDNSSKAFSYYERAVNIAEHSLPKNHPDLQMYCKNLEDIKKDNVTSFLFLNNKNKVVV